MSTNQNKALLAIRPNIPQAKIDSKTSKEESFQNETLRPIIKFLNDTILYSVKYHISLFNKDFKKEDNFKKEAILKTFLQKNQKIKVSLNGMVMGLMTADELAEYFSSPSEYKRRIIQMIEQRVMGQLPFFN